MDFEINNNNQLIKEAFLDEEAWWAIKQTKINFIETGADPRDVPYIKSHVASSWIRSRTLGIDPHQSSFSTTLTTDEYQKIYQKNKRLIEIAHPLLLMLEDVHLSSEYILELIEPSGVTLHYAGKLDLHSIVDKESIFNENTMGTNAHSLCMMHKIPLQVLGPEHYCYSLHNLAASAAPILDENDNPIASLLLTQPLPTTPWSPEYQKLLAHSMGLTISLASAVENQLKFQNCYYLLKSVDAKIKSADITSKKANSILQAAIASVGENIIAVNRDGKIMQISPEAAFLLKVAPENAIEHRIEEFCELQWYEDILNKQVKSEIRISVQIASRPYIICANIITDSDTNEIDGAILKLDSGENKKRSMPKTDIGDIARITFSDILGISPQIERAIKQGQKFANSSENILIVGESGTGKEYFAQAIHNEACPLGPFMSINCAAIPPRLIESELFGYEGGSFTGAERNGRPGKIELAHGGSLFLDEIGDMPLELQAVLLRVLENKRVIRLGGKSYKQVDFRLVAATNKNLSAMVQEGSFREDLFYRLSILTMQLPPLRTRRGDIHFFAKYFLDECKVKNNNAEISFTPETLKVIETFNWPGNVRQLKNAIFFAYYSALGMGNITPQDLPSNINTEDSQLRPYAAEAIGAGGERMPEILSLRKLEESAIKLALLHTHNSVAKAADLLEISKATLYRKLKEHDMQE